MNIIIEDDIKETLRVRRKDIITVDYGILSSCWSLMPQVYLSLKSPVGSSEYEEYKVGNITVFINKELSLEDEVRIKYPKYASDLSGKEFEVVGTIPPIP